MYIVFILCSVRFVHLFFDKEYYMEHLKQYLRDITDFPKKGIVFKDISPLLGTPQAFHEVIDSLATYWNSRIDGILALDARGFIFGSALAYKLGVPLKLARKKGKLPGNTMRVSYGLEYGADVLEVQEDSFQGGVRVLIVDDLLATGGTAKAACTLVEVLGATVAGCAFVIELSELDGRMKLEGYEVQSLITY